MVAREVFAPRNYAALGRALRVYRDPADSLKRYFRGTGTYPHRPRLRTPLGDVAPMLHHPHDMWTVHEIFCRTDYPARRSVRTVVDIGSNIGISGLYFLTRSPESRVWLHEPVPRNADRLEENLASYGGRFSLNRAAVAASAGRVSFGVEDSGRYGGIGVDLPETIEVECLAIGDVLEGVLSTAGSIDVLKVDTEGAEIETVSAIAPEHLERIGAIYLEVEAPVALHPELFATSYANKTLRLKRRG